MAEQFCIKFQVIDEYGNFPVFECVVKKSLNINHLYQNRLYE